MLDRDAEALLAAAAAAGALSYDQMSPEEARRVYAEARRATMAPRIQLPEIRELQIPSGEAVIGARLYRPEAEGVLPLLVFYHGGGWVIGDLNTHDGLCRRLAAEAGVAVLAVDYRLAPEHPFPAAFNDALAAYAWAQREAQALGIDPARMAVGGDSAGGNLAAAVCLARHAAGAPLPRVQMLIYPALDFAMDTASHRDFASGYMLTRRVMEWFRNCYLPQGEQSGDWRSSPMRATDLTGLPETLLLTAGYDPLRDEGEAWGQRLVEAGVAVSQLRIPGQVHGFLPMDGAMAAAIPAAEWLARHLKSALA